MAYKMKYPDDFIDKVICGDCLEVMKDIPKDVVLFTDPPYNNDLDLQWLSDVHIRKGTPINLCDEKIVNNQGEIDYNILWQFSRRLVWGYPYIFDVKATGWIVWDKQPNVQWRGLTTPIEIASTTLRKGYDLFHCMWAGYLADFDTNECRVKHPTQKPLKLIRGCIDRFTKSDDIILDPFLGSGTTAVACKQLNRHFIGIEINPDYCKIARERLMGTPDSLFKDMK